MPQGSQQREQKVWSSETSSGCLTHSQKTGWGGQSAESKERRPKGSDGQAREQRVLVCVGGCAQQCQPRSGSN